MNFIISITVISVIIDSCWTQTTIEVQRSITPKATLKPPKKETVSITQGGNANLQDLWVYKPVAHFQEKRAGGEPESRLKGFKPPHSLTKLAKAMDKTYAFDPYFSKGHFEPFERRPNLVTLVAFRKNGFIPRKIVKASEEKSSEVAVLQSPFNEISSF